MNNSPISHRKRGAFSRLELLWTSAAVAVVAAISLPSLQTARENAAKSDGNRANLRALYLATTQYAQDHDERFFPMNYWGTNTYWWGETLGNIPYSTAGTGCDFSRGILTPYLPSTQTLFSPAFPLRRRAASPGVAFAYNYRFLGGNFQTESPETPENAATARRSEVANPSRTVLFADSARWNHFTSGKAAFVEENPFLSPPYPDLYPTFHGRHNGYGHVLFLDGSIEAFKPLRGVRSAKNLNAPANLGHLPQEWFDRK